MKYVSRLSLPPPMPPGVGPAVALRSMFSWRVPWNKTNCFAASAGMRFQPKVEQSSASPWIAMIAITPRKSRMHSSMASPARYFSAPATVVQKI